MSLSQKQTKKTVQKRNQGRRIMRYNIVCMDVGGMCVCVSVCVCNVGFGGYSVHWFRLGNISTKTKTRQQYYQYSYSTCEDCIYIISKYGHV